MKERIDKRARRKAEREAVRIAEERLKETEAEEELPVPEEVVAIQKEAEELALGKDYIAKREARLSNQPTMLRRNKSLSGSLANASRHSSAARTVLA